MNTKWQSSSRSFFSRTKLFSAVASIVRSFPSPCLALSISSSATWTCLGNPLMEQFFGKLSPASIHTVAPDRCLMALLMEPLLPTNWLHSRGSLTLIDLEWHCFDLCISLFNSPCSVRQQLSSVPLILHSEVLCEPVMTHVVCACLHTSIMLWADTLLGNVNTTSTSSSKLPVKPVVWKCGGIYFTISCGSRPAKLTSKGACRTWMLHWSAPITHTAHRKWRWAEGTWKVERKAMMMSFKTASIVFAKLKVKRS